MSDVARVEKPWGYELHWARTARYVGKVIHINKGHALSLQYHNIKEETIFLFAGKLLFEIEVDGQLVAREMQPGEAAHDVDERHHVDFGERGGDVHRPRAARASSRRLLRLF